MQKFIAARCCACFNASKFIGLWHMLMSRLIIVWLLLATLITPSLAQVPQVCDAIGEFQPRRTLYLNSEHRQAVAIAEEERSPEQRKRLQAAVSTLDRMLSQAIAREGAGSFTAGMLRYDVSRLLSAGASLAGRMPYNEEVAALDVMIGTARSHEQIEVLAAALGPRLKSDVWRDHVHRLYPTVFRTVTHGFGNDARQIPLLRAIVARIPPESPVREAVLREQLQTAAKLASDRFKFEARIDLMAALAANVAAEDEVRNLVESLFPEYKSRIEADILAAQNYNPRSNNNYGFQCRYLDNVEAVFQILRSKGMNQLATDVLPRLIARRGMDVITGTDTLGFYDNARPLLAGRLIDFDAYKTGLELLGRVEGICQEYQSNFSACAAIAIADAAKSLNITEEARILFSDAVSIIKSNQILDVESMYRGLLGQGGLELRSGVAANASRILDEAMTVNQKTVTDIRNVAEADRHPAKLMENMILAASAQGDHARVELQFKDLIAYFSIGSSFNIDASGPDFYQNREFIRNVISNLYVQHFRGRLCIGCSAEFTEAAETFMISSFDDFRGLNDGYELKNRAIAYISFNLFKSKKLRLEQKEIYAKKLIDYYIKQSSISGSLTIMNAEKFFRFLERSSHLRGNITKIAEIIALYVIGPNNSADASEPDKFFQALIERDLINKRRLVTDTITTPLLSALNFGADYQVFQDIDDIARHLLAAGYSVASRLVFEDLVRLTRPENELRASDPTFVSDYQRGLASILVPAHARLAQFASERKDWAEARFHLVRVRAIAMARLTREWSAASEQASTLFREFKPALRLAAQIGTRLSSEPTVGTDRIAFTEVAFADLQRAMMSDIALSFQASQKRRITADPALADAIRRRDEAEQGLLEVALFGKGARKLDAGTVDALEAKHKAALAEASAVIARLLPVPEELTSIESVSLATARRQLLGNEGLVVLHSGSHNVYGMLVRKEGPAKAWVSRATVKELEARISMVRAGLDVSGGLLPRFPFDEAHGLFETLLGPVRAEIGTLSRLIVVTDGPLQALPLGILPVRKPASEPATPAEFRSAGVEWLALGPSIVYLPSVRSLDQRGRQQLASRAAHAFLGIGDPVLAGSPGPVRSIDVSVVMTRRSLADPAALRRLPALPDTRHEIMALSAALGAKPDDILLGDRATEGAIRKLRLADYQIIGFATHGLVAGDLDGLAEPGLVLTPPAKSSADDDGILTMSEISQMKFDADLVILSACNTASSDGRIGAPGLSGLARAFLGAGARGLIVTHWAIPSAPAVELTTKAAAVMKTDPGGGWDRALRSAVFELIRNAGPPEHAHPANWGAFVVFGLQGTGQAQ